MTAAVPPRFKWQFVWTVLAMTLVISYLAFLKGSFESRLRLSFHVESAGSLFEGMKINYKGFEVGKLTQLELTPRGDVRGQVEIRAQHAAFFTLGSTLKISKEKIVTAELLLQRDESQNEVLAENANIPIVRDDLAADLTKRLDPLLQKFQQLLTQLADPKVGVQANLQQSRQVISHTIKTLDEATHAMQVISDEQKGLPAVLSQTRDTMQALQPTANQATETLKELQKTLTQTTGTLAQTSKTLDNADNLIQSVDATVQDIQAAPLYRWLVPSKKPDTETKPAN
jgi:ABC-type transporter Mla subunit MlaD